MPSSWGGTRELPPGAYRIDTHEDMICGAFDPVLVAANVDLDLEHRGSTTTQTVQPSGMLGAIALDQARSDLLDGVSKS